MSALPKLKVVRLPFGIPQEEVMEIEQAMYRFNYNDMAAILVEGKPVRSHQELLDIANSEEFKGKELLEVTVVAEIVAGG